MATIAMSHLLGTAPGAIAALLWGGIVGERPGVGAMLITEPAMLGLDGVRERWWERLEAWAIGRRHRPCGTTIELGGWAIAAAESGGERSGHGGGVADAGLPTAIPGDAAASSAPLRAAS